MKSTFLFIRICSTCTFSKQVLVKSSETPCILFQWLEIINNNTNIYDCFFFFFNSHKSCHFSLELALFTEPLQSPAYRETAVSDLCSPLSSIGTYSKFDFFFFTYLFLYSCMELVRNIFVLAEIIFFSLFACDLAKKKKNKLCYGDSVRVQVFV